MSYADGMLCAVPDGKKEEFLAVSRAMAAVFKEFGATSVVDCWGDDIPDGKLTSMPMAVKAEPGETVVLSWITWPDKAARDAGWEAAMQDPRMAPDATPMPFDGKRLIMGGFEVVHEA
ncbi:DUF1428 domain-containing protein [Roseivivax sp. GX 12232]|uniref:DUF1428 domain-containing protein n=1 Tax=Roseivivax sp. GX 12232 TaxID=2900547 RepID=UPI001E48508D|nr:DUF1428 domain-containing protein [Roseivivax sp. GX 12232]MCE0505898.1 DUF1428 domain-containing protein [Roseivivax sp. GX 12232]